MGFLSGLFRSRDAPRNSTSGSAYHFFMGNYESFSNIDQYKKPDRIKSLYYHLLIYTRSTVELMVQKDALKDKIEQLKAEEEKIRITIDSLYAEIQNLVPADSIEELYSTTQIDDA